MQKYLPGKKKLTGALKIHPGRWPLQPYGIAVNYSEKSEHGSE